MLLNFQLMPTFKRLFGSASGIGKEDDNHVAANNTGKPSEDASPEGATEEKTTEQVVLARAVQAKNKEVN